MKTYRSPGGPPRTPPSPSPATRSRVPSSTPAGTLTARVFSSRTFPAPLQVVQASRITLPAPPHCGQVRDTAKKPCEKRIWPRPPQPEHVTGEVPGRAPEPLQVVHDTERGTWIEASLPNTASSKVSSRS